MDENAMITLWCIRRGDAQRSDDYKLFAEPLTPDGRIVTSSSSSTPNFFLQLCPQHGGRNFLIAFTGSKVSLLEVHNRWSSSFFAGIRDEASMCIHLEGTIPRGVWGHAGAVLMMSSAGQNVTCMSTTGEEIVSFTLPATSRVMQYEGAPRREVPLCALVSSELRALVVGWDR